VSSPNPDPDWHPASGIDGKRRGQGGDDLHRFPTPGSNTHLRAANLPNAHPHAKSLPPILAAAPSADQSRKRRAFAGWDVSRPRPGWYAYRIAGPAELPS
jgi:hypothetical protein